LIRNYISIIICHSEKITNAIDYYFHFDRDSAAIDFAGEQDWGDALSPGYGNYSEQEVDGETYYTFEQ